MKATLTRGSRAYAAASLLVGAGAAALVLAAPAGAAVSGGVNAAPGFGGKFGTTCAYKVSVAATGPAGVTFVDNDFTLIGGGAVTPSGGVATVDWTPTTPGVHVIKAFQGASRAQSVPITVGTGLNVGSACLVF